MSSLAEQNEVRNDCKNVLIGEKQMKIFIWKKKKRKGKLNQKHIVLNNAGHPSLGVLGSRSLKKNESINRL